MANDNQEMLNLLRQLINQQNSGGMFGQKAAEFGSTPKPRDEAARAKEAAKIMSNEMSGQMKESLKTLPKQLSKAIDGSSNKLAKEIAGGAKKIQDVLRVEDQVSAMKQISNGLKEIGTKTFQSQQEADEALAELEEIAHRAGLSLKQLGIEVRESSDDLENFSYSIKDSEDVIENMSEAVEDTTKALEDAKEETERMEKATEKATRGFLRIWAVLKKSADIFRQEVSYSVQRATADAGYIKGIKTLGISQLEYAKILAETRQEQFAMQSAGIDFGQQLAQNTDRLKDLTGSNSEAALVQQLLTKNAARMGVAQDKLGNAVGDQITAYEKNARAYGMSAMEVAKLTENLMEDDNFRMEMVRLKGKERKEFVLGIAQRQKEFKTMGFTEERAKALQKTFADLAGMNPKERMKKAAKKRAMLGALGMGAEGARLMDLEMRYQYESDPEKKEKMQKEMAQIQSKASGKFLEKTGAGASIGSAMQWAQMAEKTGFKDMVSVFETQSGEGLKHQEETAENTNEINQSIKDAKKIWDSIDATLKSSIGSLGAGLGGMALGTVTPSITRKLVSKGSSLFKGTKGAMPKATAPGVGGAVPEALASESNLLKGMKIGGKILSKVAAPLTAALSGYTKYEELKDRKDLTTGQKATQVGTTTVGAGAGTMGGAAAGAALGTLLLPGVGTVLGGLIGGVAGALTGGKVGEIVGEGVSDMMSDPTQMAKVEKTGQKTIAGQKKSKGNEAARKERQEMRKKERAQRKKDSEVADEQLKATRALISYLKEINGANEEQAKAVTKTADVSEKTMRFNSMPDRRAEF